MFKQAIFLILCALLVSGCANHLDLGGQAFNRGQYDLAAQYWNPLAQQGNPYAQYNLGIMWEQGLGTTQKNDAAASQWYLKAAQQGHTSSMIALARTQRRLGFFAPAESWLNLAARWNDQAAIDSLRVWGKPIPHPDLYYAQELERQLRAERGAAAMAAGFKSLGRGLGCLAAGGGCSSSDTSYSYSPPARATKTISTYQEENSSDDDPPVPDLDLDLDLVLPGEEPTRNRCPTTSPYYLSPSCLGD